MFLYRLTIAVLMVGCTHNFIECAQTDYETKAFNSVDKEIDTHINVSPDEIASNEGGEKDVAVAFRENFLTDPVDNEAPGRRRKIKRIMAQVRVDSRSGQISDKKYDLIELREDVALKLDDKEKALEAELNGLSGARVGWTILTATGVLTTMGGVALLLNKDTRPIGAGVAIGGAAATVGGGAKLCKTMGREKVLRVAIKQTNTMKNDWEESFKEK